MSISSGKLIGVKVYFLEGGTVRTWPLFTRGRTFDALVDLLSIAPIQYIPVSTATTVDPWPE